MKAKWQLGLSASLVLLVSACTTDSTATNSPATPSSAPKTTVSVTTTTTVTEQDPDEAVEVARQLLDAVMAEDQTAIVEFVEVPEGMDQTTHQVRNIFKFAVAMGWLDDLGDCGVDQSEETAPPVVVSCEVLSAHPIIGFPDQSTSWKLHIHEGRVVDADAAPYTGMTDGDEQLLDWLRATRPTVSEQRCGVDAYEASDAVTDVTSYPIHPRCGSYLSDMMGTYFISTDPDHPVAVWETFDALWNAKDMEVLSLLAEDAVIRTESTDVRVYRGLEEIREWVVFEFDIFEDFSNYWYDYEVDGSNVAFTGAWGPKGQPPVTARRYTSVVEDGLIKEWNSGQTIMQSGVPVTESDDG